MTTVSLLKSYMPPRLDLLMDTLPSYIRFKPQDSLTIGDIIYDLRMHTLCEYTNSLNETTPSEGSITSGVEAMTLVDKSAKSVYTDQSDHKVSVGDRKETGAALTDITPGVSAVKKKRKRNGKNKISSSSKDQVSGNPNLLASTSDQTKGQAACWASTNIPVDRVTSRSPRKV